MHFCCLLLLAPAAGAAELALSFTNLAPLDEATEGLYEGWAIIDGAPVSTGVFNVNAAGQPVMPGGGAVIPSFPVGGDSVWPRPSRSPWNRSATPIPARPA